MDRSRRKRYKLSYCEDVIDDYPHNINFYLKRPHGDIALHDFENVATERM